MRTAVAPFNSRPSKPGQTLKGMLGYGGTNEELQDTERLLQKTGGVLPRPAQQESSVVAAIQENEARLQAAEAHQRLASRKSQQKQEAYAARYHQRDEKMEQEAKRAEEAFNGGSVAYALYRLDCEYEPK